MTVIAASALAQGDVLVLPDGHHLVTLLWPQANTAYNPSSGPGGLAGYPSTDVTVTVAGLGGGLGGYSQDNIVLTFPPAQNVTIYP